MTIEPSLIGTIVTVVMGLIAGSAVVVGLYIRLVVRITQMETRFEVHIEQFQEDVKKLGDLYRRLLEREKDI